MSSPLISLCMIAFDEEELLPRALANWRDLADELIVVVDNRTTDQTIAVAEKWGARVLPYNGVAPGNKGEARNVGIDAAAGKFIIVLDADEIIAQPAELRTYLIGSSAHGLHVQFMNFDEAGNPALIWNQMRIFRRGAYRYQYREHEIPIPILENLNEITTDAVFEHRPPPDRQAGKGGLMLERLKLDVKEHPDDPHPAYFLHRQYMLTGDYEAAITAGHHYLAIAGDNDKCEAYGNLATCHAACGETYLAVQYLHRALADQPQRRIWWIKLAELYHEDGQNNTALAYLRAAAELWPAAQQHYQPALDQNYLYELMTHCQMAIAQGGNHHGEQNSQ